MEKYRLPLNVKPELYELFLYPNLATEMFHGKVRIHVNVLQDTKSISMHSNFLTIDKINTTKGSTTYVLDQTYELLTIENADHSDFRVGNEIIEIDYHGKMNGITGLYTSVYKTSNGEQRKIATSKFEPTYARQAFPSFDEPNLKARYKVHLLKSKDSNYIALSNFPQKSIEPYGEDGELVTFDETVPMSTYLACFIVSDFKYTYFTFENYGETIPLRVFASPENVDKTSYAGKVAKKVMEYYVNYFQIAYPLPKLDMVAIPDFVSGATEHWGLVTYRETALLYDNTTHSSTNKQRVASVISHELAHSWFGNLVTMDWWNDLWLNEGFATYIQYKGTHAVEPSWGMMDQFIANELYSVLLRDSEESSHPVVQKVLTPDQITEVFDSISYSKGASILRMLENTVGEEKFQKAVSHYLKKHAYGNAVTSSLLKEIQNLVDPNFDVEEMMSTFTEQTGYPCLTVTVNDSIYMLTQERFLKNKKTASNENESKYKYKWTVPVTYVTNLGKSKEFTLFKHTDKSIQIEKPRDAAWIKFNYDQIGYYRVNYPSSEWAKLKNAYSDHSTADRTHLLADSFNLAEAGLISYVIPLDMSMKLLNEFDYLPWNVAGQELKYLLNLLANSKHVESLETFINKTVSLAYRYYTWKESTTDTHLNKLARVEVIELACIANHQECLNEAKRMFRNWLDTQEPISPDIRTLVYTYGMATASESDFEKVLELYKKETDATEKTKLMYCLASIYDLKLLERLLNLAKDPNFIRDQDFFQLLRRVSENRKSGDLTWKWVMNNWDYLVKRFTLNNRYFGAIIPIITSQFASQEKYDEMLSFFKEHKKAGAGQANRKRALETVKYNIDWRNKYQAVIETWLDSNNYTKQT